jgi:hypothetical protein
MSTDRIGALEALLAETETAHGAYEATELNGVYDQEWPRWYAAYAVEHGIGEIIGRPVSADELAEFLTMSWSQLQQADPKPAEPWTASFARRMAEEL